MSRVCPTCRTAYPDAGFFCGNDGSITLEVQPEGKADARIGQQLGGYLVVARVADGAMGRVYEGRHLETKARVAIKVLHEYVSRDRVAVERFKREYEAAREMNHPNIVKVLEFGETPDKSWFMTMEYLEGRELSKATAGKQPLSKASIVHVVCQVALALEHAHSFGFIHRDLKPDNIFLCDTPSGVEVRILDFGSVKMQMETGQKLTALGMTLGSPYYMSPEQALGQSDVDQRSDVFALGAILWEMVTGSVAFEASSVAVILRKILSESPPPASSLNAESPVALDDVIEKAIRKEKTRRYDSARALAEAAATAYGLSGTIESWAHRPEAEIARAVAAATPPAPKPFGSSLAPGELSAAALPARGQPRAPAMAGAGVNSIDSSLRPAGIGTNSKLWLGVGVGVLVLLAALVLLMH